MISDKDILTLANWDTNLLLSGVFKCIFSLTTKLNNLGGQVRCGDTIRTPTWQQLITNSRLDNAGVAGGGQVLLERMISVHYCNIAFAESVLSGDNSKIPLWVEQWCHLARHLISFWSLCSSYFNHHLSLTTLEECWMQQIERSELD